MDIQDKIKKFPENFLWGASSSAFQIEGGWNQDGKGKTVADFNSFKRSDKQADSKVASDFYNNWKADIDLMSELGLQLYRFSISWARIIPTGDGEINEDGIKFYDQVIDYLLEKGIMPFITLYHFDLPYALVEKYNGWEDRECAFAFERYAKICFERFGTKVKNWQVHNEQNLMVRVDERMNIDVADKWEADRMRAQMDYHMFLAHALTVKVFRKVVENGKIGPAVSSTCSYPATSKPEDVWAAKMNDCFKTEYALDMHVYGEYPKYYMRYLKERNIVPKTEAIDKDILKGATNDFIAVNYYRTLCIEHLPVDESHVLGERESIMNQVDFDQYGYFRHIKNENLKASEYGAQIDPSGLRLVLNRYYEKYRLPMIIAENGLGAHDVLTEDKKVHDGYRIDYLRDHIEACRLAMEDGVEMWGYSPWSVMDILSSHQGFKKRYGFVYINRDDFDLKDMKRIKKDSFYWYQKVIQTHGEEI
ncbi:MAG: glycoside hydrolase family 1 protein [Cetobacterium sp.]|uniref:glycoside hydrolase family 1 protein n=1 Tax=Cetobacterium sp. TaxID=2071632 RepID=UPI003F2F205C